MQWSGLARTQHAQQVMWVEADASSLHNYVCYHKVAWLTVTGQQRGQDRAG